MKLRPTTEKEPNIQTSHPVIPYHQPDSSNGPKFGSFNTPKYCKIFALNFSVIFDSSIVNFS